MTLNNSRKPSNNSIANIPTGKTPTKRAELKSKKTPNKSAKKSPSK